MSNKKSLLEEALKRHQQIVEYTFYTQENDDPDFPQGEFDEDDLLLGEQEPPAEEEPADVAPPLEEPAGDVGGEELPAPEPMDLGGEEGTEELPAPEPMDTDMTGGLEIEDEFAEEPATDMGGTGEEVEVDVTDIVTKAEEAKAASEESKSATEEVGSKLEGLLSQFEELTTKLGDMDQIVNKIDELEQEIEKRNPTPVERLEMRSMDSFPYTVKLTDFWDNKEGYETGSEKEEYVLTQKDVEGDYNEREIRDSFKPDTDEEY
jgi:hypothetical protein